MFYKQSIQFLSLAEAQIFVKLLQVGDCDSLTINKATICNNYIIRKYKNKVDSVFIDKLWCIDDNGPQINNFVWNESCCFVNRFPPEYQDFINRTFAISEIGQFLLAKYLFDGQITRDLIDILDLRKVKKVLFRLEPKRQTEYFNKQLNYSNLALILTHHFRKHNPSNPFLYSHQSAKIQYSTFFELQTVN